MILRDGVAVEMVVYDNDDDDVAGEMVVYDDDDDDVAGEMVVYDDDVAVEMVLLLMMIQ